MIQPRLEKQLTWMYRIRHRAQLWKRLAICWLSVSFLVLVLRVVRWLGGFWFAPSELIVLGVGILAALAIWIRERRRPVDLRSVVADLEARHPEARPLLSTALEQEPDPVTGEWSFLQVRVIRQVITHDRQHQWRGVLQQKLLLANVFHTLALIAVIAVFSFRDSTPSLPRKAWFAENITVEPGDVELERGTGLVITARFEKNPPVEATLVMSSPSGETKRLSLDRHLADPVFGASLREVMESSVYHIEYAGGKTREFAIRVFDYPALVRADASLEFPQYTGLTNKTIPDTMRISAVEGTRLDYHFELNKPVAQARLLSPGESIELDFGTNQVASLNDFVLTNSGRYALQLIDAEGRTNRRTAEIVIQVLPDKRPDLKLTFPQGDQRVSSVQELQLLAEVMDDFGLVKYGFGFGVAGEEPTLIELGQQSGREEKRRIGHLIDLEAMKLEVNEAVSYFVWADDFGPGGEVRRTYSDMFFAEVRPYEEIFRADQSSAGEAGEPGQGRGSGGGGSENTRLTELQKQIVIATWKIQREKRDATRVSKP